LPVEAIKPAAYAASPGAGGKEPSEYAQERQTDRGRISVIGYHAAFPNLDGTKTLSEVIRPGKLLSWGQPQSLRAAL